jgi:hypothetical protein
MRRRKNDTKYLARDHNQSGKTEKSRSRIKIFTSKSQQQRASIRLWCEREQESFKRVDLLIEHG